MFHLFSSSLLTAFQTRQRLQVRFLQGNCFRLHFRSHDLAVFDRRLTCFTRCQTSFLLSQQVAVTSFLFGDQVATCNFLTRQQQLTDSSLGFLGSSNASFVFSQTLFQTLFDGLRFTFCFLLTQVGSAFVVELFVGSGFLRSRLFGSLSRFRSFCSLRCFSSFRRFCFLVVFAALGAFAFLALEPPLTGSVGEVSLRFTAMVVSSSYN